MKKNIRIARKLITDIYDDLMKEIPSIREDETLDEEVDRELEMEAELGATQDESLDVVMKALKKRYDIQSNNLSDILDEAAQKAKKDEIMSEEEQGLFN